MTKSKQSNPDILQPGRMLQTYPWVVATFHVLLVDAILPNHFLSKSFPFQCIWWYEYYMYMYFSLQTETEIPRDKIILLANQLETLWMR